MIPGLLAQVEAKLPHLRGSKGERNEPLQGAAQHTKGAPLEPLEALEALEAHQVTFAGRALTFQFIDKPAYLTALQERLQGAERLYLDTEFQTYKGGCTLALIQVSDGAQLFVIDALELARDKRLAQLLSSVDEWVLHDARADIPLLCRALDIPPPKRLFDTQVALSFIGYPPDTGLAKLCEELGHEADKTYQAARFLERPLSSELLYYAALDVPPLVSFFETYAPTLSARALMRGVYEESKGRFSAKKWLQLEQRYSELPERSPDELARERHRALLEARGAYERLMSVEALTETERAPFDARWAEHRPSQLSFDKLVAFDALMQWRDAEYTIKALEPNSPELTVAMPSPKLLKQLAQLSPTSLEKLRGLQGFDPAWVVRYGERAITLMSHYRALAAHALQTQQGRAQESAQESVEQVAQQGAQQGTEQGAELGAELGAEQTTAATPPPTQPLSEREHKVYQGWLTYLVELLAYQTGVHISCVIHPKWIKNMTLSHRPQTAQELASQLQPLYSGWRAEAYLETFERLAQLLPLPYMMEPMKGAPQSTSTRREA